MQQLFRNIVYRSLSSSRKIIVNINVLIVNIRILLNKTDLPIVILFNSAMENPSLHNFGSSKTRHIDLKICFTIIFLSIFSSLHLYSVYKFHEFL